MSWIEKLAGTHEPASQKQLRSFGLIVGTIFLLIGLWPAVMRASQARTWAVILGVALLIPGIALPQILRPAYRVWMVIGFALGWVNSRIIMGIVFFMVITPVAGVLRILKKVPINLGFDKTQNTYRVNREARASSHMKNQF